LIYAFNELVEPFYEYERKITQLLVSDVEAVAASRLQCHDVSDLPSLDLNCRPSGQKVRAF